MNTPNSSSTNGNRIIPLTCSGHTRPVVDIQFSSITPQGKYYLISACKDGNPMLREGVTGDWIGTFQGHKGAVWSARLSRDSEKAVTGSADFSAKVWDTHNGQELHSFVHNHIVRAADFNEDSTKILTGGKEQKLRIFDLYRPEAPPMELQGHEGMIKAVVWDETHRHTVLSAGDDATVRIWDLRTMRQSGTIQCEAPVSTMTFDGSGEYIAWAAGKQPTSGSLDPALRMSRLSSPKRRRPLSLFILAIRSLLLEATRICGFVSTTLSLAKSQRSTRAIMDPFIQ
ncbi:unnamed protein product [Mucor fragilis]